MGEKCFLKPIILQNKGHRTLLEGRKIIPKLYFIEEKNNLKILSLRKNEKPSMKIHRRKMTLNTHSSG